MRWTMLSHILRSDEPTPAFLEVMSGHLLSFRLSFLRVKVEG